MYDSDSPADDSAMAMWAESSAAAAAHGSHSPHRTRGFPGWVTVDPANIEDCEFTNKNAGLKHENDHVIREN